MDLTEEQIKIVEPHASDEVFWSLLLEIIEQSIELRKDRLASKSKGDFYETAQETLIERGGCIALTELSQELTNLIPQE